MVNLQMSLSRRKLSGMRRLFRPELSLAAGICTLTGQILAVDGLPTLSHALLAFACVFFLSGTALILNDLFDYEVDKINAPHRPLPAGDVSPADVIGLTVFTSLAGLACALALNMAAFGVALLLWVIGFVYNCRAKQAGLLGNLMVSCSVGMTFIFGAISVNAPWNVYVWAFSLMAFFLDLGEEIAGDAMDAEGDKQRGSRSIALVKGRVYALRMSLIFWAVAILSSLLPFINGWPGIDFVITAGAYTGLVIFFGRRLWRSNDAESGHRAMRGAYMGGTLCIIFFMLWRLVR
ncbi:MAG: UbiA family prenyltransferase [Anaerolineae bacterium]|nr:UbiA family prenyltransferase [Anaerolineae bacterium]